MPAAANAPVIWTVSVSRLAGLLADVAHEFADRARFVAIDQAFDEASAAIAARLRREHCDVVVAGGANAAFLRGRLEVPLVSVAASGFDLMAALTRARRIHPQVGLVTHAGDLPDINGFADAFGLDIAHRSFETREEARDCVAGLQAAGIGVIVGTGMAIDFAEAAGLPGVLLYSADAVRRSYEQALLLAHGSEVAGNGRRQRNARSSGRHRLIGDSAAMAALRERIALYAPQPGSVLICGPSGTGKGLVAQQLHATSARPGRLVSCHCAQADSHSLDAQLGSGDSGRRGSALLDAALGGSLLLDGVDELPLPQQARLLRLLDLPALQRGPGQRTVEVRLLASCQQPLEPLVAQGRFRADLYHRLAALPLPVPALRERGDDLDLLLGHYLAVGGPVVPLAADARALLHAHRWPGNVRELRNLAERIALLWRHRPQGVVDAAWLRCHLPELDDESPASAPPPASSGRPDAAALRTALARCGGDRSRLMAHYGVSRTTLWRWLRAAGIE